MIPDQLSDEKLIQLRGKQPVGSTTDGPFFDAADTELIGWVEDSGNVGVVLDGELIAVDIDAQEMFDAVADHLPETFTVRTGSGGEHRYYRCPEWTENRSLTTDTSGEVGSVRSDGWQTVIPPSTHPDTGREYRVRIDRPITAVEAGTVEAVISAIDGDEPPEGTADQPAQPAAAAPPCVGGSSVPSIPTDYPDRPLSWETAKAWLASNGLLEEFNRTTGDRSSREFLLAKCLAEGGFSETGIRGVLDRLPFGSKWQERDDEYRTRTVRKAIQAAADDPYVDWETNPGDMDGNTSESRKTEESGEGRTLPGGENMAEYNDHEEVTALEGTEDGDSFKKVVRTTREEDGETVEYVSLKKGHIEAVQTVNGEEVLAERVSDSKSLGSPEYIGELVDALKELDEQLNGSE